MTPTIGRIVLYKPTEAQNNEWENSHKHNTAEVLPAVVVAVWSDVCVNLKILTDGETDLWVTSALKGNGENEWNWPVIKKD